MTPAQSCRWARLAPDFGRAIRADAGGRTNGSDRFWSRCGGRPLQLLIPNGRDLLQGQSVIEHPPLLMRTKPAWIAVQMTGGAAALTAGLVASDATSAVGVFWMAWALSTLADRIQVEDLVLRRQSILGAAPALDLTRLTRVDLTRFTSSYRGVPSLALVLDAEDSRRLNVTLWKWTNSKELARLVAQTTLAVGSDLGREPKLEMSETTRRRLRALITS